MRETEGTYYDGRSSRGHRVRLRLDAARGEIALDGRDVRRTHPISGVEVSAALGDTMRAVRFPDGGLCELREGEVADEILRAQGRGRRGRVVDALERSWRALLALALVTALAAAGFVRWGVPALAERGARVLPAATARAIGEEALRMMDRQYFGPTKLPEDERDRLRARFDDLAADLPPGPSYRLTFRTGGPVGANALALPSGLVVMTDELAALAENDAELLGVLAHELGHARHSHALRMLLQNSALQLALSLAVGEVRSVSKLAAALPGILLVTAYSREFEEEADRFALEFLKRHGIPPRHLADILKRLEEERGGPLPEALDYLSTHPPTRERVKLFEGEE